MSQIEAVFFDCDGTLVDSEVICSRAYVTMFQEFGITLDPEEVFKRFKGVKLYEIIDIVSLEHGVTLAKTEAEHVYRVRFRTGSHRRGWSAPVSYHCANVCGI